MHILPTKEPIRLLISPRLTYEGLPVQGIRAPGIGRVMARLAEAVRFVLDFPRRQAVLAELSRLGDRELADIGLERGELNRAVTRFPR